jgi:Flp pilus assembly protein TadG
MKRFLCGRGAALVEFAVSSAVLFLCLFGIVAFCTALYSYNFIGQAAREASRYAMVRGSSCKGLTDCGITPAQIQTYFKRLGYPGINPANLTATATGSGGTAPVTPCQSP